MFRDGRRRPADNVLSLLTYPSSVTSAAPAGRGEAEGGVERRSDCRTAKPDTAHFLRYRYQIDDDYDPGGRNPTSDGSLTS